MKKMNIFCSNRFLFQEVHGIDRGAVKTQQLPEDDYHKYIENGSMRPEEVAKIANFLGDSRLLAAIPSNLPIVTINTANWDGRLLSKTEQHWVYERDGIKIEVKVDHRDRESGNRFFVTFLAMNDRRSPDWLPGVSCWLEQDGKITVSKREGKIMRPITVSYPSVGHGSSPGYIVNPQHDLLIRKFVTEFLKKNFR